MMANLLPFDGELMLTPGFIPPEVSQTLLHKLLQQVSWRSDVIRMFGKTYAVPRLTAYHGDEGTEYRYSGLVMHPLPWTSELDELRQKVEEATGRRYNAVLLNCYRDGKDHVGWHADNESSLGTNPVIATISLGVRRTLQFRHLRQRDAKLDVTLPDGSLLLMEGVIQSNWQHRLKRQPSIQGSRISLTFRKIIS